MNEVASAETPKPRRNAEPTVLALGGGLLLALSAFFLWKELSLATEALAFAGASIAALIAYLAHRKEQGVVGPMALGFATLVCGVWYGALREPLILGGLGVTFAASLALTLVGQRAFPGMAARLHRRASWLVTAAAGLASSLALYFHVFDATESSLNDFVARRALLTLAWLLSGAGLVVAGRKRDAHEMRDAGFVVLAASMAKMLLYDLAHTDGYVRIVALGIGGAALVLASGVTRLVGGRKEA